MSIHRAFRPAVLLAALLGGGLPQAARGGESAAAQPAESGETLPNPAGRGFPIGDTGLTLGGYVTGDAENLEGEDHYSQLNAHLFVFYEPWRYIRLFADLELAAAAVALDRGHLDIPFSDALSLRLGKFLTPFGRWNQAHIEPLTWTASEPLLVESVFDDTISGASVSGSFFPKGGALSYVAYASLVDPIAVDADEGFAEDNAGTRIEWASLGGWTAGLSWYASRPPLGQWHHVGGVDVLWQPHHRLEISAEALAGEGSRGDGPVRGAYLQAAVRTIDSLYLVGRVEGLDLPGPLPQARFGTLGAVWAPLPSVRLKTDYLFANDVGEIAGPGLRMSLSWLF